MKALVTKTFRYASGAVAQAVPVLVVLRGTDTPANLYSALDRALSVPNPLRTSNLGEVEFQVEDGAYDFVVNDVRVQFEVVTAHQEAIDSAVLSLRGNPPADLDTLGEIASRVSSHEARKDNPHTVTKAQVGLGAVDNTSDLEKPVSNLTKQALDAHEARKDNPHAVTKAQVGLGAVDNTSDADKPVSVATQAAIDTRETPSGAQAKITAHLQSVDPHPQYAMDTDLKAANISYAGGPSLPPGGTVETALDTLDEWRMGKSIVATTDLNTVLNPGTYLNLSANAVAPGTNSPIPGAGSLTVFRNSDRAYVAQEYVSFSQRTFKRWSIDSGATWAPWREYAGIGTSVPGGVIVGEGQPNGVAAPVGTRYVDSTAAAGAIEWTKVAGTSTTGWKCLTGDTGPRYAGNLLANGWTAVAPNSWGPTVQRVGSLVTVDAYVNPSAATSTEVLVLPSGFRPRNISFGTYFVTAVASPLTAYVELTGSLKTYPGQPAANGFIKIVFHTNDLWPAALPGVAM